MDTATGFANAVLFRTPAHQRHLSLRNLEAIKPVAVGATQIVAATAARATIIGFGQLGGSNTTILPGLAFFRRR